MPLCLIHLIIRRKSNVRWETHQMSRDFPTPEAIIQFIFRFCKAAMWSFHLVVPLSLISSTWWTYWNIWCLVIKTQELFICIIFWEVLTLDLLSHAESFSLQTLQAWPSHCKITWTWVYLICKVGQGLESHDAILRSAVVLEEDS